MSEQQQPAGWSDDERVRRWIAGARQRESQLTPITEALFAAAALEPGERVLDVGCGTGSTTIRAAGLVGPRGHVLGADIAPAMIETARAVAEEARTVGIQWLIADAQTHDFGASVFDVVLSRFGVMFFADPAAAFTNLARTTRPGGRLIAAVWQVRDQVPLFQIPYQTAARVLDELGLPYEPVPIDDSQCSLGTPQLVRAALEPGGWRDIEIYPSKAILHVGGGLTPAEAAREMLDIGPIRGLTDGRPEDVREQVRAALATAFEPLYDGTGVTVPAGFLTVTARRP